MTHGTGANGGTSSGSRRWIGTLSVLMTLFAGGRWLAGGGLPGHRCPDKVARPGEPLTLRGRILDAQGTVLAETRTRHVVEILATHAAPDVAELVSRQLGIDGAERLRLRARFEALVSVGPCGWQRLLEDDGREPRPSEHFDQLEGLPGVRVRRAPVRVTSLGDTGRSVIGRTRWVAGGSLGWTGVEESMQDQLSGSGTPDRQPRDVQLTLDARLMRHAAEVFEYPHIGGMLVMDVDTGALRVLYGRAPAGVDLMYSTAHRMGGTFKPLLALMALEDGVRTVDDIVRCDGAMDIARAPGCPHLHATDDVSLSDGLLTSCDGYAWRNAEALGGNRILEYARRLHLHETTGVELPREVAGNVRPAPLAPSMDIFPELYDGHDQMRATALQLASLYAAIANGGTLLQPTLLQPAGEGEPGTVVPIVRDRLPFSPEHLAEVRLALDDFTHRHPALPRMVREHGVRITGKTGRADVRFEGLHRDLESAHRRTGYNDGWFVGFTPPDDPRFLVLVFVQGEGWGGNSAAPIAVRFLDWMLETTTLD